MGDWLGQVENRPRHLNGPFIGEDPAGTRGCPAGEVIGVDQKVLVS